MGSRFIVGNPQPRRGFPFMADHQCDGTLGLPGGGAPRRQSQGTGKGRPAGTAQTPLRHMVCHEPVACTDETGPQ